MDKTILKQILLELQEQHQHVFNDHMKLVMSNNNLYRLIHKIIETPQRAEELSALMDEKEKDIIRVSGKAEKAFALNIQKIQNL